MSTTNERPTGHNYHQAHHFESVEQEYDSSKQGIWLFMVTEILMFGGLFVAFGIYSHFYPEIFKWGHQFLDWRLGGINTLVLIFSSFTMAISIHYLQVDQIKKAILNLATTVACGATFMVIKYFEYSHKIHHGLTPTRFFHYEGEVPKNGQMFFGFYYMMTGLHGVHVLVGMGLITWLIFRTKRGDFGPQHWTAVEGVGLFWHIVDLIWIFLFPMFYLI